MMKYCCLSCWNIFNASHEYSPTRRLTDHSSTMATITTDADLNESRGTEINVIAWVFTGIAISTVSLKLFSRAHVVKQLGWDDFFIFFSLVSRTKTLRSEQAK